MGNTPGNQASQAGDSHALDTQRDPKMSTILGNSYSITWRGNPPHMLNPDIPVWFRFLEIYGMFFNKLYYDSLIGAVLLTPLQEQDPIMRMWRQNTARRTDAITELDNEVWIIEVADDPGLRSIGQLLAYRVLWIRDPVILKPEKLVLVAETIEENLLDAASSYGIQIYLI